MAEKTFFEVFAEEAPAISKTFGELFNNVKSTSGLDEKTFELIYLALKAAEGATKPVCVHAGFAKKAGAKREEVRGAILVTLMTNGIVGPDSCLAAALEAYDNA